MGAEQCLVVLWGNKIIQVKHLDDLLTQATWKLTRSTI